MSNKDKLIIYWDKWYRANGEAFADTISVTENADRYYFKLEHKRKNRIAIIVLYKKDIRGYTVINKNV